jgi:hypothetical protein
MGGNCCDPDRRQGYDRRYQRVLWAVMGINAIMFMAEIVAGLIAGSASKSFGRRSGNSPPCQSSTGQGLYDGAFRTMGVDRDPPPLSRLFTQFSGQRRTSACPQMGTELERQLRSARAA